MVDFSNKLREMRLQKNITQVQLAERLHISKAMVSSYETGARLPSYEVLIRIATIFNVSIDYILGRENIKLIDVTGISDKQVAILSDLVEELKKKVT